MRLQPLTDMIELPGIWSLSPLGALLGAIIVLYWLLATGRLIPRSSHERELTAEREAHARELAAAEAGYKEAINAARLRGDEWKETTFLEREVNKVIRAQLGQSIEANRAAESFFKALSPSDLDETETPR